MIQLLLTAGWTLAGVGVGLGIRRANVYLAEREHLHPGSALWQVWGPVVFCALLFDAFAFQVGPRPVLLVYSLFVAVLVQIVFFDFEHRLILDLVQLPAAALALVWSLFMQPWWAGLASGLGAGLLFLGLAAVGTYLLRSEALGMGDVKLALFIGLLLGWPGTLRGIFYGVFLAGLGALVVIALNRGRIHGLTLAYGPFLAMGAMIELLQQAGQAGQ